VFFVVAYLLVASTKDDRICFCFVLWWIDFTLVTSTSWLFVCFRSTVLTLVEDQSSPFFSCFCQIISM